MKVQFLDISPFFEEIWRDMANTPAPKQREVPALPELKESQWCSRFEQLMRDRLIMGAFRYGLLPEDRAAGRKFDSMGSIDKHLIAYRETGNAEHLVDIANLCLIEFTNPLHENAHFAALDDGNHHAETVE